MTVVHIPARIPQWTFADRIRKARRDGGQTQQEFAGLLGVGLKTYSAWEAGSWGPRDLVATAEKLEEVTGVPRTWFLGWLDGEPDGDGAGADDGTRTRNILLGVPTLHLAAA